MLVMILTVHDYIYHQSGKVLVLILKGVAIENRVVLWVISHQSHHLRKGDFLSFIGIDYFEQGGD